LVTREADEMTDSGRAFRCVYTYVCMYMYTCMLKLMEWHTCVFTYMCVCAYRGRACIRMCRYESMNACTRAHTHERRLQGARSWQETEQLGMRNGYTYIHLYLCICSLTHTHTHIQERGLQELRRWHSDSVSTRGMGR
jgi:hypothetical protein